MVLKVFQVSKGVWYAADSADKAKELYIEYEGDYAKEEIEIFGEPKLVSEEDMDKLTVNIENEEEPKLNHNITFREHLKDFFDQEGGPFCGEEW